MKQSIELASRALSQKLREEGSLGVKERWHCKQKIVMEGHELGRGFTEISVTMAEKRLGTGQCKTEKHKKRRLTRRNYASKLSQNPSSYTPAYSS